MKLVIEHIEQFTRGGKNPFKTLNIGKRVEIENWFKTWSPDVDWAPYTKYKIDENFKIYVKGWLDLYNSAVSELPDNLHLEKWLNLRQTNIISLPDNLHIEEYLDLYRTKITFLPDNLHVGGWLDIRQTKINSLPDNLYVGNGILKDF